MSGFRFHVDTALVRRQAEELQRRRREIRDRSRILSRAAVEAERELARAHRSVDRVVRSESLLRRLGRRGRG